MTHSQLLLLAQAEVAKKRGTGGQLFLHCGPRIAAIAGLFLLVVAFAFVKYGNLWFQVYMSNADVSMLSLMAWVSGRSFPRNRASQDYGDPSGSRTSIASPASARSGSRPTIWRVVT